MMKKIVEQLLECLLALLPFFKKKNAKEVKEFSDLITGQYEFLVTQLEKVLKDYFATKTLYIGEGELIVGEKGDSPQAALSV